MTTQLPKTRPDIEALMNGDTKFAEAEIKTYQKQMQSDMEIDLAEVTSEIIRVAFRDFVDEPMIDTEGKPVLDAEGKPRTIQKPRMVIYEIDTFVPTEMFFFISQMQKDIKAIRAEEQDIDKMIKLYAEQVLKVWKLTDSSMTYERLIKGLTFKQIRGLFARFFGNLNAQMGL